jgi:hypothetical protein
LRTVDNAVIDLDENESWIWLKINAVRHIRYMETDMFGQKTLPGELVAETKGITIPTKVWWLANPSRHHGEEAE